MFEDFRRSIASRLQNEGFRIISFHSRNISGDNQFHGYYRVAEGRLIAVCLYNFDKMNIPQYNEVKHEFEEMLTGILQKYDLSDYICYDVLAAQLGKRELAQIVNSTQSVDNQNATVSFAVSFADRRVYYNANQPVTAHNIDKYISESLARLPAAAQKQPATAVRPVRRGVVGTIDAMGARKRKERQEWAVYMLLAVNIFVFALLTMNGGSTSLSVLVEYGAMVPMLVINGEYYRLFTSIFLHNGIVHLFYNMFSLYIFGYRVEKILGVVPFLLIYFVSGLAGSLLSLPFYYYRDLTYGTLSVLVGASGAIYGLMGAALAIALKLKSFYGINLISVFAMVMVGLVLGFTEQNVGYIAHIGGLISGFLLGLLIIYIHKKLARNRAKREVPTE